MATHNSMLDILQQSASSTLAKTDLQILRASNDIYRQAAVTAGSINFREGDLLTRQSAAQSMMDKFNQEKITAITYKNGTKMPIDSYSEMAGRTMSGNAAVQANLNRYQEYGFDLFKITSHFQTCPLCAPWENRVVSIDGRNPKYPTLTDAIATGYGHPNCIHNITPWREGFPVTQPRLDPEHQRLIDKHGHKKAQEIAYQAQQRQRAIERKIKDWKMREVTTLDPKTAAQAKSKVQQWQMAQRDHMKANQFLRRDYARESIKAKAQFVDIKDQANKLAKELRRAYSHDLREVTNLLKGIRDSTKTEMAHLRFRMKGPGSLTRKIQSDFRDKAGAKSVKFIADTTGDVIRYTYVIDDVDYAAKAAKIVRQMKDAGFKNYKFKNYWENPSYKGINSNWTYKGRRMEIQFHTPKSLFVQEKYSHPLYEKMRIELDPIKRAKMEKELIKIWSKVTPPHHNFVIAEYVNPADISSSAKIKKLLAETKARPPDPTKLLRKLTPEQSKAVGGYTLNDYHEINYMLRNPNNPLSKKYLTGYEDDATGLFVPGRKKQIDLINEAMKSNTLPTDYTLYRGMNNQILDTMMKGGDPGNLAGQVYRDSAYVSTSMMKNNPVTLNGKYIVEIKAPAGTQGIKIGNLSNFPDEDEFLLNAGYRYEIIGAEHSKEHPGKILVKVILRGR
jgi:hypothetical protein